jgi:hypothetical protein
MIMKENSLYGTSVLNPSITAAREYALSVVTNKLMHNSMMFLGNWYIWEQ